MANLSDNVLAALPEALDKLLRTVGMKEHSASATLTTILNNANMSGGSVTSSQLFSSVADGSSAVGFTLDTLNTFSTGGAKLVSYQNNGTEKASIDKDGGASFSGSVGVTGDLIISSFLKPFGTGILGSNSPLRITSQVSDGSTAVSVVLDTNSAFSTAGGKIVSFRNNGTEKAGLDKDGNLTITTGGGIGLGGHVPSIQGIFDVSGGVAIRGNPIYLQDQSGNSTFVTLSDSGVFQFNGSLQFGGSTAPIILAGTGSPAGVVTAPVGSLYLRGDGGANTTLYVKESGTGTSGWVAK